jgi:hypothetical protein
MENNEETRSGVPRGLPIAGVILLILGFVVMPIVDDIPEEELARNVLLAAIPVILIIASIIIFFMSFIWWVGSRLNDNISEKTYKPIEMVLIGGILLGVFFIFQPWVFELFRIGFFVLLASLVGFMVWSHVRPKPSEEDMASAGRNGAGQGSGG